ncbi:MAG: lactate racemase domain-containing protein [Chloroflexota bacterium]
MNKVIGVGYTDRFLSEDEARRIFREGLAQLDLRGKRVLVMVPDSTRSSPIPLCFRLFAENLLGRVAKLDYLIALGTHMPMDEERLCAHFGLSLVERRTKYTAVDIYNHDWQSGLRTIGVITADEARQFSGGRMAEEVKIEVNARLWDYDQLIICGPVFPHEIAGFSGGTKYFFPGVSGPAVIDFTHWLAAMITNVKTIGVLDTPVRAIINQAATMIDRPQSCFCMVVKGHDDLAGLYFGDPVAAQRTAAALSAQVNIAYVPRPFKTVLSVMPELYDDIWTAGKGMYKLEPVVADGGTLIIYAPHIDEISYTHGEAIDRIGYHVRDYFLAHPDKMHGVHRGTVAHSTVVKGAGTYVNGVERPRVTVVLATGVPKERCDMVNLGYMDPSTIRVEEWMGREDKGILVVPRAGELLYRLEHERP